MENADDHAPFYLRKSQAEQEKERAEKAAAEVSRNAEAEGGARSEDAAGNPS